MNARLRSVTAAFAAVILSTSAGSASAQYGLGWGWGGLYNPNDGSRVQAAVDQRALSQGQAAYASRPRADASSPSFQQRDDSFYDKYDLATREAMIDRVARYPDRERSTARAGGSQTQPPPHGPAPGPAPRPRQRRPPRVAGGPPRQLLRQAGRARLARAKPPASGDLGPKRQAADCRDRPPYKEYQTKGAASLETTAKARTQLLAYGRPALVDVREHATPAMTDSFHAFLLSLYADLGDAYAIPAASARR